MSTAQIFSQGPDTQPAALKLKQEKIPVASKRPLANDVRALMGLIFLMCVTHSEDSPFTNTFFKHEYHFGFLQRAIV